MLIAIIAGLETMFLAAARSKQRRLRRQQLLMGTTADSQRAVPIVDDYLQQKTARATRFQRFVARQLAALCRRVVQTRTLDYMLLHLVRTAINKRRNQLLNLKRRITL
jgi:transcription initiation factor TFIIIB Brf1 subunit/transcription initiation factor TFIIB